MLHNVVPEHGVLHQLLHRVETAGNQSGAEERLLQPAAKLPFAHGRAGFVQHPQQRALFLFGTHGFRQFQIPAGIQIQPHKPAFFIDFNLLQPFQTRALGAAQITQQLAHGPDNQRLSPVAQIFFADCVELFQHQPAAFLGIALLIGQAFQRSGELFPDKSRGALEIQGSGIHQNFPGGKTGKFTADLLLQFPVVVGQQRGMELTGGDIGKAQACLSVFHTDRGQIIVLSLIQHTVFQHGTRRHHPDNAPLYQPLCGGWVFHLLTDGHFIAFLHQPGQIGLIAVKRHAAHGRPLFQPAVPSGQGQIQFPGSDFRIVKKHFVEVSQPKKQQGPGVFLLELEVLFHHRGKISHLFVHSIK